MLIDFLVWGLRLLLPALVGMLVVDCSCSYDHPTSGTVVEKCHTPASVAPIVAVVGRQVVAGTVTTPESYQLAVRGPAGVAEVSTDHSRYYTVAIGQRLIYHVHTGKFTGITYSVTY